MFRWSNDSPSNLLKSLAIWFWFSLIISSKCLCSFINCTKLLCNHLVLSVCALFRQPITPRTKSTNASMITAIVKLPTFFTSFLLPNSVVLNQDGYSHSQSYPNLFLQVLINLPSFKIPFIHNLCCFIWYKVHYCYFT